MAQRLRTNPWIVLLVLCTGFFMILLDTTVVNIAIPSMVDGLHASLDQVLWVLNAYILVYAVLLISAGRLGDAYGQRNMFALGLVIFTAASAYCGLAPDITHLVVARVIQGVGGALLTPQTLAILTTIFPPNRRGAAFGVWGGVAGIAAVAGPCLGGLLVTDWGWRWIFYLNLPIGIAALVGALVLVPDVRMQRRHGFDLVGVLLASAGLFSIVFALVEGERFHWGTITGFISISIPMLIGVGVALIAVFIVWERFQAEPLVPLVLFRERNFSLLNWVAVTVNFGMIGMFLPITIYFQSVLGMSALQAGLTMAPLSVVGMIMAPISGRMADRIGGKYLLFTGALIYIGGMGTLLFIANEASTTWTFFPPFAVAGVGLGMILAPMATIAMRNVSPEMAGAASGVYNTTRQLGSVIGTSVVGAVLQSQLAVRLPQQAAAASSALPPEFRQRFVDGFSQAARGGLALAPGQSGSLPLPPGIPAAIAQQLQVVAHGVFTSSFVLAMRPSLAVPVVVVLTGALSSLFVSRRKRAQAANENTATPELALAS